MGNSEFLFQHLGISFSPYKLRKVIASKYRAVGAKKTRWSHNISSAEYHQMNSDHSYWCFIVSILNISHSATYSKELAATVALGLKSVWYEKPYGHSTILIFFVKLGSSLNICNIIPISVFENFFYTKSPTELSGRKWSQHDVRLGDFYWWIEIRKGMWFMMLCFASLRPPTMRNLRNTASLWSYTRFSKKWKQHCYLCRQPGSIVSLKESYDKNQLL